MWLQAKHLHTSAERRVSPVASLSPPELLSDLFTCSPHAAQAKKKKKDEGNKRGEKMVGNRKREEGGRGWEGGWLRTGKKRQRGEKRGNKQKECVQAMITRR